MTQFFPLNRDGLAFRCVGQLSVKTQLVMQPQIGEEAAAKGLQIRDVFDEARFAGKMAKSVWQATSKK